MGYREDQQDAKDADIEAKLDEDEHGLSELDRQRPHIFNAGIKNYGEEKGCISYADWRLKDKEEREASRKWRGPIGAQLDARRLWMIRTRLLEAADLSAEEETFYLTFLNAHFLDKVPELLPCLAADDLWQGYRPYRSAPYKQLQLDKVFGPVALTADGVKQAREKLKAAGLWGLNEEERRARHKHGGYSGARAIAHSIGASQYMSLTPCINGCPATTPHLTKSRKCFECHAIDVEERRRWPMDNWVAQQRATAKPARRSTKAMRVAGAKRVRVHRARKRAGQ